MGLNASLGEGRGHQMVIHQMVIMYSTRQLPLKLVARTRPKYNNQLRISQNAGFRDEGLGIGVYRGCGRGLGIQV